MTKLNSKGAGRFETFTEYDFPIDSCLEIDETHFKLGKTILIGTDDEDRDFIAFQISFRPMDKEWIEDHVDSDRGPSRNYKAIGVYFLKADSEALFPWQRRELKDKDNYVLQDAVFKPQLNNEWEYKNLLTKLKVACQATGLKPGIRLGAWWDRGKYTFFINPWLD